MKGANSNNTYQELSPEGLIVSDLIDIVAADGQVHEAEMKVVEVVVSELGCRGLRTS